MTKTAKGREDFESYLDVEISYIVRVEEGLG
jgi:hypothetical protein